MLNRLLVTGASGGVATLLRPLLNKLARTVLLSDIKEVTNLLDHEEFALADLRDLNQVNSIVDGCDGIIHLGGISTENTFENILQANIIGVHNLYTAALACGKPRIVFASSNHAVGAYKFSDNIDASALPKPDSYYGVSKVFGEAVASMYFDKFGQETGVVRIGSCFEKPVDPRMLSTWFSISDFFSLIDRIFSTENLGYKIVYGASNNTRRFWNDELSKDLGWQPSDNAETYADEFIDTSRFEEAIQNGLMTYQGGIWLKSPLHTK